MQKSGFNVYLQHLSGCKFFLRRLIALPLLTVTLPVSPRSSAAQPGSDSLVDPAILPQLTQEWNEHKTSQEHLAAIQASQRSDQPRLSIRLSILQKQVNEAAMLALRRDKGEIDFCDLSPTEQKILQDYDINTGPRKELQ